MQPQDMRQWSVRRKRQLFVRGELGRVAVQQVRGGRQFGVLGRVELLLVRRWVLGPDLSLGVPVFKVQRPRVLRRDRWAVRLHEQRNEWVLGQNNEMRDVHRQLLRSEVFVVVLPNVVW